MTETVEFSNTRNMRLVGGRRVRVLDLIRTGLLTAGDELVFDRRRSGETYRASITADGRIRLADGREFLTPSSAAKEATGGTAIDGWTAWAVSRAGELLDALRQSYLDHARVGAGHGDGAAASGEATTRQHAFLKEARDAAAHDDPRQLTVRDLIGRWDAATRSPTVDSVIENDLANHGLTTVPSFRKVGLETPIVLHLVAQVTDVAGAEPEDMNEEEAHDRGLTLGNLPSALRGVESVSPHSSFDEAITKMLLNDYSQLAVLGSPFTLRGAVTWKSIAQAPHYNSAAPITDAIVPTDAAPYDTELIDVLRRLYDDDFIFVKGPDKRIAGVVTAADVVLAYGDLSMPFLLVGQIDILLRRLIARHFLLEDVIFICDPDSSRKLCDFDDLTLGDYQRALEVPQMWTRLGWKVDRKAFTRRLDEIRHLRNDITHFNPDPLPDAAIGKLRNFMLFLKRYAV